MTELEKVKERIAKLAAITESAGSSAAEVETAMKRIGALLEQYNLELDDATVKAEILARRVHFTGYKNKPTYDTSVVKIGTFTDTKVWFMRDKQKMLSYNFFGFESDAIIAQYLCGVIHRAWATGSEEFKDSWTYRASSERRKTLTDYQTGFVNEINKRLDAMIAHREVSEDKAMESQQAAPSYASNHPGAVKAQSTALVLTLKTERVDKEMKEKFGFIPKTGKGGSRRRATFLAAYQAGASDGAKVRLNTAINNGGSNARRLEKN